MKLICLPSVSIFSEQSVRLKGLGGRHGNGSLDLCRLAAHNRVLFLWSYVSLWV